MMEKRNFVTSARTPEAGAADIDDILDAGAAGFSRKTSIKTSNAFEKKASDEDEKSDNL